MGGGRNLALPKDFPLPFPRSDRQQSKQAEREDSGFEAEDWLHFSLSNCPQFQSNGMNNSDPLTGLLGWDELIRGKFWAFGSFSYQQVLSSCKELSPPGVWWDQQQVSPEPRGSSFLVWAAASLHCAIWAQHPGLHPSPDLNSTNILGSSLLLRFFPIHLEHIQPSKNITPVFSPSAIE